MLYLSQNAHKSNNLWTKQCHPNKPLRHVNKVKTVKRDLKSLCMSVCISTYKELWSAVLLWMLYNYKRTFEGDDVCLTWVETSCRQGSWHDSLAVRCNKHLRSNQALKLGHRLLLPQLPPLAFWKITCALTEQYHWTINNLVARQIKNVQYSRWERKHI